MSKEDASGLRESDLVPEPKSPLRGQLERLRETADSAIKQLAPVRKALDGLLREGGFSDLRNVEKRLSVLTSASLDGMPMEDALDEVVEVLAEYRDRRLKAARMKLVSLLHRSAADDGLEIHKLGDSPPTFLIQPVAVEIHFDRSEVSLIYAREEVLKVALDVKAILKGRRQAMGMIREHDISSAEFFDLLQQAYHIVRTARGVPKGQRIDLVDTLLPLSLLRADSQRWRRLEPSRLNPFTRYQLAYHLARLRRDGMLEKDGTRLDLGTATGGSTRNKRDVLFVPSGFEGEGQYYLSLRFV